MATNPWDADPPAKGGKEYPSGTNPWDADPEAGQAMTLTQRVMDSVFGPSDAALTIGSGLLGATVGGLAGVASLPWGIDTARRNQDAVQGFIAQPPRTEWGGQTVEAAGQLMEGVSDVGTQAVAGVAGLGAGLIHGDGNVGANTVRAIQDKGVKQQLGDEVFDATGSPLAATGAYMAPDVAFAASAFKGGTPRPTQAPVPQVKTAAEAAAEARAADMASANAIKKGKVGPLAEVIDPNPEMVQAFDELGIAHTPGAVSENQVFRTQQSALKSKPGSTLPAVDDLTLRELSRKSEEMITEFGGQTDRSLLDANLRADFEAHIGSLERQADVAWGQLNRSLDQAAPVEVRELATALETHATNLGGGDIARGVSMLPKEEATLWKMITRRVENPETGEIGFDFIKPSYAAVDQARKDIGRGMKGQGVFRDADAGNLDYLYGMLARPQQSAAAAQGMGAEFNAANKLIVERKAVEDAAVTALGRDMGRGSLSAIDKAANDLASGNVQSFNRLIEAVPEARRQEVALAVIQNMFSPGKQTGAGIKGGFIARWEGINRNTVAKEALFSHLPPEALRRFDLIGRAAKGFYRSLKSDNHSNTAVALLTVLEDGSMIGKIAGGAGKLAAAESISTTAGMPGAGTAIQIGKWVLAKRGTPSAVADSLMSSPQLATAVREYAAGKVAAANKIMDTKVWKNWFNNVGLNEAQKAQITSVGFMEWLVSQEEEAQ